MENSDRDKILAELDPFRWEKTTFTANAKPCDPRREKLIALGSARLADALLELGVHDNTADQLIERLISSPKDNLARFYRELDSIRQHETYYDWREHGEFIEELESLIGLIVEAAPPTRETLDALVALFEADADICESCHDDGEIGIFFQVDVCNLFVQHAAACDDKQWLIDTILKLNAHDNYGCRCMLFDRVAEFLLEPQLRSMVERMWKLAKGKERGHWLCGLKSVAKQLADPELLERAWDEHCPEGLPDKAIFELVEVWLGKGDAAKAKAYLARTTRKDDYQYRQLLERILRELDEKEELAALLRREFSHYRSAENLKKLLELVGEDQRGKIIAEEAEAIAAAEWFNEHDVEFLLFSGLDEAAAQHVLRHAGKIVGAMSFGLESLAQAFAKLGYPLPAMVLYRAMVDATLEAKKSKYYHHAVSHLCEMKRLAATITDWGEFQSHQAYFDNLRVVHARKSGFWSQL